MALRDELFFDTSAFVKYYNKEPAGSKVVKYWIDDYNNTRAEKLSFFLPNICITETLQVLYYSRFVTGKIKTDELFLIMKANFLNDLENNKYFIYQIGQKDIVKALDIYEIAKDVYLTDTTRDFLSAMDIKIIAMAISFKVKHPNFYLVTSDNNMYKVANRLNLKVLDPNNYQTFPHDRFNPPL